MAITQTAVKLPTGDTTYVDGDGNPYRVDGYGVMYVPTPSVTYFTTKHAAVTASAADLTNAKKAGPTVIGWK